jgi:hypothetical protein
MSSLDYYQNTLAEHFKQLSKQRQGKTEIIFPSRSLFETSMQPSLIQSPKSDRIVFLLEHPFSIDEIKEIKQLIRNNTNEIKNKILKLDWLLLVLLTEHAYQYNGKGSGYEKGFWNPFEKELGITLAEIDKNKIKELFDKIRNYGVNIAKSFETDWAKQFKRIALPITHAVLPLDCRLPLMETLAIIPQQYWEEQNKILTFVKSYTPPSSSKRYNDWQQCFPIAEEFLRALAFDDDIPNLLQTKTLNRIRRDIENDKIVGKSLRDFKRKYKNKQKEKTVNTQTTITTKNTTAKNDVYYGTLFLHENLHENKSIWTLKGQLHKKCLEIFRNNQLQKDLQYGKWKPQAWNCFIVKPGAFLNQECFDINSEYWAEINNGKPFVEAPNDCINKIKDAIKAFRFRMAYPTVFEQEDENTWKQCSVNKIFTDKKIYVCILANKEIKKIDSSNESDLDWARKHGIEVIELPCWKWIIPFGKIDKHERTITLSKNEQFFLRIEDGKEININGETFAGIVQFDLTDNKIEINGEMWETCLVDNLDECNYFTAELSGELTVNTLKKGELSLLVDSLGPFMNVDYTVTLYCANKTAVSCTGILEEFPAKISKKKLFASEFKKRDQRLQELLFSQEDLQLILDIQGLYRQEWTLEYVLNGIWWENNSQKMPTAMSDGEEFIVEEILHKSDRYQIYDSEFCLYRAKYADSLCPVYRAETILKCPNESHLSEHILPFPQHVKRRKNDTNESVGLTNVVDDILAFRQARTDNFVAEIQRMKIIEDLEIIFWEITCGKYSQKLYELKKLIYPLEIASDLYKNKSFLNTPEYLLNEFEHCRKAIQYSPYNGLWNKQVVKNLFTLFYNSSQFIDEFKEQTIQAMLLDRQMMRVFAFLIAAQREKLNESENEIY